MQAVHALGIKGDNDSLSEPFLLCPGTGHRLGHTGTQQHRGSPGRPPEQGLETSLREGQQGSTPGLETELLPTLCKLVTLAIGLAF